MWKEEKVENSSNVQPRFSLYCESGQISLNLLPRNPDYLTTKLEDYRYKEHIRMYNSMLLFTSIGTHIDRSVTHDRGPYIFRINGKIYHRIGSLFLNWICNWSMFNYISVIRNVKFWIDWVLWVEKIVMA